MMRAVLVMAAKDLRLLWSDKFGVFWIFAFPLMYALFFGAIFGGSGGGTARMEVIVVDEDGSDASKSLVSTLTESAALRVITADEAGAPITVAGARASVADGDVVAVLRIPEGYGGDTLAMFRPGTPALELGIDPARRAEAAYLQGIITEAAFRRMQTLFEDPSQMVGDLDVVIDDIQNSDDIPPAQRLTLSAFMQSLRMFAMKVDWDAIEGDAAGGGEADGDGPSFNPVRIEMAEVLREGVAPPSAFAVSFPQAMSWGLIGCCAGFAIGLVQEKTRGTYARLLVGPITRGQVLAGKGLSCFVSCVLALGVLVGFGMIFGVRVSSWGALVLAVGSAAACFTGLMMLVSTLGKTEQAVAGAGWAAMMPLAMLGGGMVPLMVMPGWMQQVSSVSPVKWAIVGFEGALWRGSDLATMMVSSGVLVAVGVVGLALGSWILSRRSP